MVVKKLKKFLCFFTLLKVSVSRDLLHSCFFMILIHLGPFFLCILLLISLFLFYHIILISWDRRICIQIRVSLTLMSQTQLYTNDTAEPNRFFCNCFFLAHFFHDSNWFGPKVHVMYSRGFEVICLRFLMFNSNYAASSVARTRLSLSILFCHDHCCF